MVGTVSVQPSTACARPTGTVTWMSAPSREKKGSGSTARLTYRWPAAPPRSPASPWPGSRMVTPVSTPGGTATCTARGRRAVPAPPHDRHGFLIVTPSPPHARHVTSAAKKPFCMACCPLPLHTAHVAGLLAPPSAEPLPPHGSHGDATSTLTVREQPFTASMKLSGSVVSKSRPRRDAARQGLAGDPCAGSHPRLQY